MAWSRNQHGFKDTADSYRTFKGERYVGWLVNPSPDLIAAYRAAGLKCRRIGDELFLRETDQEAAHEINETKEYLK